MADFITSHDGTWGDDRETPPGGRDSRWPLFAQGRPGDRAKPNAWQLMVLSDLSGADGRCAGATDDEVFGVLGQWGAAGAWLEGRKLSVVRELIRRRPDEKNAGTATESGLPWEWDDRLAREVALELRVSVPAARKLIDVAWALEARLPGIGAALDAGRLDLGKARMIAEETSVLLEPDKLAAAELLILAGLDKCKGWAELQRLVQRAVVTVDPEGARKRREREEKENARVRFWREAAGTCAIAGFGLPTDEALRAQAHIEQRAQQYRAAGVKRPIDILRVAAFLDLLNHVEVARRVAWFTAQDEAESEEKARQARADAKLRAAARAARNRAAGSEGTGDDAADGSEASEGHAGPGEAEPGGYPWDCPPGDGQPSPEDSGDCRGTTRSCHGWPPGEPPCETCGRESCQCGGPASDDSPRDTGGSRGQSTQEPEPGVAAEVNLTLRHLDIPFLTAAGLAQRAGEARSLGILDPELARRIAETAARHPDSTFCLTLTDSEGRAIGHGCCKPRKSRKTRKSRKNGNSRKSPRDGPPPPAPPKAAEGIAAFTLTPNDDPGPPGGYGSWIMTLPGRVGEFTVDLHPVPTGDCGHQYESARHHPGDLLRHLVTIRDAKCGFPSCSRHARESDFEHAQPFDEGGRTCGCNCWSASRSCHQVKQSEGWDVTETRPGYHQWTTPSGRQYTQEPWHYAP